MKASRLALLGLVLCAAGCEAEQDDPRPDATEVHFVRSELERSTQSASNAEVAQIARSNTEFALKMYELLADNDENVWFSPWSLTTALAMAWAGATEPTATEIATTLGFPNDQELVHVALNTLDRKFKADSRDLTLKTANSFWLLPTLTPQDTYLDTLATHYGAGVGLVDFTDQAAALRLINGWVSDQTLGTIPELLREQDLTQDTKAVLTNALYLQARWKVPFAESATTERDFSRNDGSRVKVPMMSNRIDDASYATGNDYQAGALPYRRGDGPRLEMVFVLPQGDIDTFEETLSADRLTTILEDLSRGTVEIEAPRFQLRAAARLKHELSQLGMPTAFADDRAFENISDPPPDAIHQVVHEGYVSVDEVGTEASAATAVIFGDGSAPIFVEDPPLLVLDRPFIFAIRHVDSNLLLFLGRVMDPTSG